MPTLLVVDDAAVDRRFVGDTFDGHTVEGLPIGFDRAGSLLLSRAGITPIRYGELRRTRGALS